jgi:23S rRNA (uracil1939-C5)-methyltransferase
MKTRSQTASSIIEVMVEKVVYGGAGLARHEGKVVFLPFTAAGDRVKARVVEQKKNFIRASVVELLQPGPGRQVPPCPHFGSCGGCQWQHLEYPRQLETKRAILEEIFHHRFPETRDLNIEMKGCPEPFGYRSRARIQMRGFGEASKIGFFQFHAHDVEDVESCPLFRPLLNTALESIRETRRSATSDPGVQQMELACSSEEGAWAAVNLHTAGDPTAEFETESGDGEETLLRRKVGEFVYWVSPSTFFQANDFLLKDLVETVSDLSRDAGTGAALDLFSGVGLFTLPLAHHFQRVVAIEESALASRLCGRNAQDSGLVNVEVVCAEASAWMPAEASNQAFDLIVLDPPRAGASAKIFERLIQWGAPTIVYVACDPQTLARDLALLSPHFYRIDFVRGFDLFPQTYHFETVVRLRGRKL